MVVTRLLVMASSAGTMCVSRGRGVVTATLTVKVRFSFILSYCQIKKERFSFSHAGITMHAKM